MFDVKFRVHTKWFCHRFVVCLQWNGHKKKNTRKSHAVLTRIANLVAGGTTDNNNGNAHNDSDDGRDQFALQFYRTREVNNGRNAKSHYNLLSRLSSHIIPISAFRLSSFRSTPLTHPMRTPKWCLVLLGRFYQSYAFHFNFGNFVVCCSMRRHAFELFFT